VNNMAVVRENIPSASGKSSIAQMLAQRAQPPAMAAAPSQVPLNGVRGMPPTPLMRPPLPPVAAAPPGAPAVAGGMPQAAVPAAIKQMMLARMFGSGGGPGGPGGAPPIG
jgi:hypothetical protein